MAISLPGGPDRPPSKLPRRIIARKPRRPRTTSGNRYTSAPPPVRPPATPGAASPVLPPKSTQKVGPDKYHYWRSIDPSIATGLQAIDMAEQSHLGWVNDKVMPWLSGGLTGLAGINSAAQDTYKASMQGMGGALGVAAGMTPLNTSAGPGGGTYAPNSWQTKMGGGLAASAGATVDQIGAYQAMINKLQPTTLSMGYMNALADYAKGLPMQYTERRRKYTDEAMSFIAEQQAAAAEMQERERHNRVMEAIGATNAETNAAIGFGRLGLDANDQAFDNTSSTNTEPLPDGFVWVPDGKGGYKTQRDPNHVAPGSGSTSGGGGGSVNKDSQGRKKVAVLQTEGYTRLAPRYIKNGTPKVNRQVFDVAPGADGGWWIKRKKQPGSGSTAKVKEYGSLTDDLAKKWEGTANPYTGAGTPGWSERFRGNPEQMGAALAGWVIENKASFTTNGKFDVTKARRVVDTLGDGGKKWALIWAVLKPRIRNGALR
jgi:hypothetical protein